MSAPLPTVTPAPSTSVGWWITTILGGIAAVLVPISTNCTFGPQICPVLAAIAGGLALLLGVTHPGIGTTTPPKA